MRNLTRDILGATIERRFWRHVTPGDPDTCWEWQGARTPERPNKIVGFSFGYGRMSFRHPTLGQKQEYAHRISYVLMRGDIPEDKIVMHECDNPRCVNPHHLKLGTYEENAQDRERKCRSPNGHRDKALLRYHAIGDDYQRGMKWGDIAAKHNCGLSTVRNALCVMGIPTTRQR